MKTGRRRNLRRRRASVHRTPLWITAALLALAVVVTAFHVGRRYSVSHAEPGPARYTVPGTAEPSFWRDPFARLSGPDLPVVEVAIVIDDLGASLPNALELIDISPKFTLAVLPWQGASEEILAEARARGVETILHQPMEPHARQPRRIEGMLLRRMSAGEIRAVLTENLDRYPGIAGINNHMGSAFTEDRRAMDAVMKVLAERGLVFLDSMTTARSVGADAARAARLEFYRRDVFLDNEKTTSYMDGMWRRFRRRARRQGRAVLIGHGRRETIDYLRRRVPRMEEEGLVLVPLTRLLPEAPGGET